MDFRTGKEYGEIPLVTIGVLSYNYALYIEEALNSLLTQTYPHIELIIIDDCSSDECPRIVKNWIRQNKLICTYIRHEENLGITKTSNAIVRLAKGKYLSLFATDDIMLPEKIERQVKLLERAGEDYGVCYANPETIDEQGVKTGYYSQAKHVYEGDILEKYALGNLTLATPAALLRISVYNRVGLYDERVLFEDYNLWLRVFSCYKAKYCNYPCLKYRIKEKSEILNKWFANNRERYYHDKIISNFQALSFTKNKTVKQHLQKKIIQYLKSLGAANSKYFSELFFYLFSNRYFNLPYKELILINLRNIFRLRHTRSQYKSAKPE